MSVKYDNNLDITYWQKVITDYSTILIEYSELYDIFHQKDPHIFIDPKEIYFIKHVFNYNFTG